MIKVIFCLLLSQFTSAAENRKYIQVGQNPVNPRLVLNGEKIFPVREDTLLTTLDKNGHKHTGWLSDDYHFVGKLKKGRWEAVRIYECGNPIIEPRIILRERGMYWTRSDCPLKTRDWLVWTVGPGLMGYGGGIREGLPMGVGGGLIVIDLFGRSDKKNRKCLMIKRGLIGIASAGIGWLIGDSMYKPERPKTGQSSPGTSGGPGPVPPNGLALRF